MTARGASVVASALIAGGVLCGDAWGQAPKQGAAKAAQPAAEKPAVPDGTRLAILIHTAVVAMSQANLTGNYSVLHAMGSPAFQQANPPEKLAQTFANVRKIDLTPVILFAPVLSRPPAVDDKNMLRLTGYYKTAPQQVLFDLLYQPVAGQWRLFGISIGTQVPQQAGAAPQAADKTTPKAAADKKKATAPAAKK